MSNVECRIKNEKNLGVVPESRPPLMLSFVEV